MSAKQESSIFIIIQNVELFVSKTGLCNDCRSVDIGLIVDN